MGNPFSLLILAIYPVITLAMFARFRPQVALLAAYLGGMLFLPEKTELFVPFYPLGKQEVTAIGCLLGVMLIGKNRRMFFAAKPMRGPDLWTVAFMVGAFGTSFINPEPLHYGPVFLMGLNTYEAICVCVGDLYNQMIPFVLGRAFFRTRDDARLLLRASQLAAVIYVPFIAVELVMSPMWHTWIYGFMQHDFAQTVRAGGYRPMVFMNHGLALTLMLAAGILAGNVLTLAKSPGLFRLRARWFSIALLIVLLGCKSLGAAIFAILFTAVLHFLAPRWQMRVLMMFAALVVFYPVSRATEVFPHKEITDFIKAKFGEERAGSLEFRFDNEAKLTEHGSKKLVFGWGRFGRAMLYDGESDKPSSVGDGHWINTYTIRGAWGFICFFGLILTPIFYIRRRQRLIQSPSDRYILVGSCCILMMYIVDLIPNGLFTNYPIMFAGALLGLAKGLTEPQPPQNMQPMMMPMQMPMPPQATV